VRKFALLGLAAGLVAVVLVTRSSQAADHLDAPTIATNPMGDINDVYAWITSDGQTINLAMTVSPADDGTRSFDPSIQYVWHVTSHPGATNQAAFGKPGTEVNVICTFASNTSAQCWVASGTTTKDYITGDPSATTGITNASHKLKLFAGRRSDPFFFNFGGFIAAQLLVDAACNGACPGSLAHDAAGCPTLDVATAGVIRSLLTGTQSVQRGPCAPNVADCFASFNVMAIVVQVDKSLLLGPSDHLLSVWGSTHATP
jgi:Domain of unknown function (DUF4331)